MEWTDFSECAEYLLAALDRHWAGLEEIVKLVSGVFLFYCDGEDDHENILGAILLQRLVETHSIPEVFRN
jgi:hypothetical protein